MSTQQMEDERKAWAQACQGFEQIEQSLSARIDILESSVSVALGYLIMEQPEMAKVILATVSKAPKMPQERALAPEEPFLPPEGSPYTIEE